MQTKATTQTISSIVSGTGKFLPEKVITNSYFESYLETSDEWITDRTGIKERRWADEGVTVSMLAESAAKDAISNAGLNANDIDGIIFATVSPDHVFPSSACVLQSRLGIASALAFDINAVCSGFIYAFLLADSLIKSHHCQHVLVIGGDVFSNLVDKNDRSTCVLFGDGAGALVLSSAESLGLPSSGDTSSLRGVYGGEMHADGSGGDILMVKSMRTAVTRNLTPESLIKNEYYLTMAGREVFKLAVRALVEVNLSVLDKHGLSVNDVDYFVTHQANKRICDAMAKGLGATPEKVLSNVDKYGNTSAGTVPILLAESDKSVIKKGDLVLLSAFGGGLTWAAALVRW
jgi:3-oxoacyl-[acyl-carrier-protein] synthase-3